MSTFLDRAASIAATAATIARLQGATIEATVLSVAQPSLLETGFDSYDGSNSLHTLMLQVPIPTYAELEDIEGIEKSIQRRVSQIIRPDLGNLITEVIISPKPAGDSILPVVAASPDGAPEEVPSFWQAGYFRVFITHLAGNKASAHKLKEALAIYQVAAFVAHDDIEPTREWQSEIERALRTMDALIAILSPGFIQSKWCDQEVGIAIGRGKLVLPLRAGADPHGFMGKNQALQVGASDAYALAPKIVDIFSQHPLSSDRMTEALVDRLVGSSSFDSSKRTIALLEKASRLNTAQVARLVRSIDENVDVREAWGVPQRIKDLVSKIGTAAV